MEENLIQSILLVCQTFNTHAVQYLIVGGTAVALHGYFRQSITIYGDVAEKPDLDFWYNPTYENYFNLLNALEALGQNVSVFKREKAPNPKKSFFKLEMKKFSLDLLPQIKADLNFRDAYKKRDIVSLNEINIPFLSYEDLIIDKKSNARPKDLSDIEHLKNINRNLE